MASDRKKNLISGSCNYIIPISVCQILFPHLLILTQNNSLKTRVHPGKNWVRKRTFQKSSDLSTDPSQKSETLKWILKLKIVIFHTHSGADEFTRK